MKRFFIVILAIFCFFSTNAYSSSTSKYLDNGYFVNATATDLKSKISKKQIDPKFKAPRNVSLLAIAAIESKNLDVLNVLMDAGIDVNTLDDLGNTALQYSISNEDPKRSLEVLKLLMRAGAKIDIKNKRGSTPLHLASGLMNKEYIEILVNAGADVNTQETLLGRSVLMNAIENKAEKEVIHYLIDKGADVNTEDKYGSTALILAIKHYPDIDVIKTLIKAGADVNKGRDTITGNVLQSAYLNLVSEDIIEVLIQNGADATAKNSNGIDMKTYKLYWEQKMK